MTDDLRVSERWFSDRLQQQVTVMRWGLFGRPVLVFPSAGGDAGEIERHGLVDACGPLLADGRIKLYSVDSVAGQAMVRKEGSVEHRLWLLNQFHEFVRWEVVPAIHADLGGQAIDVITAGASIGAFNAVATLCRYPDVFAAAIGMSGSYQIDRFYGEAWNQDLDFSPRCSSCPACRARSWTASASAGSSSPPARASGKTSANPGRWPTPWAPRESPTAWTTGARDGPTSGPPGAGCSPSTSTNSSPEAVTSRPL